MQPQAQKPLTLMGVPAIICSKSMQQLLGMVERLARTATAVLISGESGTGKELIARAIHSYSLRCANPWVDINCAALPEHLVESELFGYEKRSEEHTSELQSPCNLVCRLLLEKKKKNR